MRKFLLTLFLLFTGLATFGQSTLMPIPAHGSVYSGATRGYWFTAPNCFTITDVRVPTEASSLAQNIAVIRFNAVPPTYSTVTNTFTVLALFQNVAGTNSIPVDIQVEQGDIIGILGTRGTANSYATGSYSTNIGGAAVTLERLGFQANLNTVAPYDLWTEPGGSISRSEMYYVMGHTHTPSINIVGNTVDFTINSDTSFGVAWDFGDGSPIANMHSPTHTYAPGVYTACAYITTTCGVDTVCISVPLCAPAATAFTNTTSALTASFSNTTTGAISYLWDFGDGTTDTSTTPSPHTYATSGAYTVCLITESACGAMDTVCSVVNVCIPPAGSFGSTTLGRDTVNFTESGSQGLSFAWDFGDGSVDSVQNPSHIYAASGAYTVCLITSNPCGSDTTCETVNICLTPPVAGFTASGAGLTTSFTDVSTDAVSWNWTFGDGGTDNTQNPTHTYTANGDFVVCLVAMNACGESNTFCDTVTICVAPVAAFTSSASLGVVTFTDGSSLPTSWLWDFGDGNTSTLASPTHTYTTAGLYNVCLTTTNSCGVDSTCSSINVVLIGIQDPANGTSVSVFPNPANGQATVMVRGDKSSPYQFELYNLAGAKVRSLSGAMNAETHIDLNGISAGMYLFHVVMDDNTTYTGKLTVK